MACLDPVLLKHVGCACLISVSSATRWKIDLMEHLAYRSAIVCAITMRIKSREAIDGTKTSHRTRTMWGRQIQFTETDKHTRNKTGKNRLVNFHVSKTYPNLSSNPTRYKFSLKPYNPDHKPPTPKDLVYFEQSPGFCEKNLRLGILGTHGRQCNDTSIGVDGCDLMCCGRGYRTQEVTVVERCACTFHWCCEVKCKTCRTKKTIHTCL